MTVTFDVDTAIMTICKISRADEESDKMDFFNGGGRENKSVREVVDLQSSLFGPQSRHIDFPGPRIPCGRPLPSLSRALYFHDDTSPLTPSSRGRDPVLPEHKPAQSERSAR